MLPRSSEAQPWFRRSVPTHLPSHKAVGLVLLERGRRGPPVPRRRARAGAPPSFRLWDHARWASSLHTTNTQPTHTSGVSHARMGSFCFVLCDAWHVCLCGATPQTQNPTTLFARRGGRLQPTLRSLAPCSHPHTDLSSASSPVSRPLTTLKPCATRNLLPSSTREARQPTHPTYNLRPSSTCEARQPTLGGP